MIPALTRRMLERRADWWPMETAPGRLHYSCIAGSIEGGTTTFLAFAEGLRRPVFVVKAHRDPAAWARVERERDVLQAIGKAGIPLTADVPRVLLAERVGGVDVLVQSVLRGQPMDAPLVTGGALDLAAAGARMERVSEWLIRLRRATMIDSPSVARSLEAQLREGVGRFTRHAEGAALVDGLVASGLRSLPELVALRPSLVHGDLARQNILVDAGTSAPALHVIDWTDARLAGLPLHDLFFFISTYVLQARGGSRPDDVRRAFADAFTNDGPLRDVVRTCVFAHADRVGVPRTAISDLFTLFLIERTLFEWEKHDRAARVGGLPRFAVYLAAQAGGSYRGALRAQWWSPMLTQLASEHERAFT